MDLNATILTAISKARPTIRYGVAELNLYPFIPLYLQPLYDDRVPLKENDWCEGLVKNLRQFPTHGEKRLWNMIVQKIMRGTEKG